MMARRRILAVSAARRRTQPYVAARDNLADRRTQPDKAGASGARPISGLQPSYR